MTGRHVETHITITVVCPHIGCPWSIEAGNAPIEAHNAYIEHLDVHDIETLECGCPTSGIQSHGCTAPDLHRPDFDDCDQEDGEEAARSDEAVDELAAVCGLYAGDHPAQIAAEQARVDRFMAGGDGQ